MKTIQSLFKYTFVAAIFAAAFGCENIENPEPINVVDSTKTATITGEVFADLDLVEEGREHAPSGTVVKVVLESSDFVSNSNPNVNYEPMTFTTTVNASGEYSIVIPALDRPVTAKIYLPDFSHEVVLGEEPDDREDAIFSPNEFPYEVTIVAGLTQILDLSYSSSVSVVSTAPNNLTY